MFPVVEHSTAGRVRLTGPPIKLSDTPAPKPTPAPLLGEHSRDCLRSLLGLEEAELDRLTCSGVIAQAAVPTTPSL
jgi:crotonobetainyl-CoA:carnitine CoA-transferase CaiB-like acyl-CoA transferase